MQILKGKSVTKKQPTKRIIINPLSLDLKPEHKDVVLFIDIMFVNKITFLLVKLEGINHIYAHRLRTRGESSIAKAL